MSGELMWTPPADVRDTSQLGRYLAWLERTRGLSFPGYDELWQWSVSDLEGFWGSLWEFFEVRAHAPYQQVVTGRDMPGAKWFTGSQLNFAEHALGRDEDVNNSAVVAHSQTRAPIELTFGELR